MAPEDRAKAMAFRMEKGLRCTMCGTADWEWDPAQGGKKHAYEAVGRVCQGCLIKETEQENSDRRPGFTIELRPTRGIEWAKRHILNDRRRKRQAQERREAREARKEEARVKAERNRRRNTGRIQ